MNRAFIMGEKFVRIALVFILGWFMGYMHHYSISKRGAGGLEHRISAPEQEERRTGVAFRLSKKITVKTTAYSNDPFSINVPEWRDGMTATGVLARRGLVAADWRVFPPGTRFFIPGYGAAVVEDRGGAVRGRHLDLFMDSQREALDWGVRKVDVYILEKVDGRYGESTG
jgi:3D (Asp-Asp-Asp) domain-containing protein